MVAMVLLMIICLSSAYFFAIPPFRKEALRFAALERAAGMLDLACVYEQLTGKTKLGYVQINDSPLVFPDSTASATNKMSFGHDMPSVWNTFHVTSTNLTAPSSQIVKEAEIKLYDNQNDTNSLFATLKMILPPKRVNP